LDYQNSGTTFLGDRPFPAQGANLDGQTTVAALRFFQEWTQRSERDVLAARSEFNVGLGILGATTAFDAAFDPNAPSTQYFMWRGQAQWVKLLAPDTLFLLRGDVQFADRPIISLEQFALGGLGSVRGYRQNTLLTDNGLFASVEVRLPILRVREMEGILQLTPFLDFGTGWNTSGFEPDPNILASTGIGLLWQAGKGVSMRLDWGIPIGRVSFRGNTWQDDGITFSIQLRP
jgi:hemolysin activation/secretion protein